MSALTCNQVRLRFCCGCCKECTRVCTPCIDCIHNAIRQCALAIRANSRGHYDRWITDAAGSSGVSSPDRHPTSESRRLAVRGASGAIDGPGQPGELSHPGGLGSFDTTADMRRLFQLLPQESTTAQHAGVRSARDVTHDTYANSTSSDTTAIVDHDFEESAICLKVAAAR